MLSTDLKFREYFIVPTPSYPFISKERLAGIVSH
jgi:hypothetical protein